MSKDQAARIAEKALGDYEHDTSHLARSIRRAITTAVSKERERCVGLVEAWCDTTLVADRAGRAALKKSIVDSINGGKR